MLILFIGDEMTLMDEWEADLRKMIPLVSIDALDQFLFTEYCIFLAEINPKGHEEWQEAFKAFWGIVVKILGECHDSR